MGNLRVSVIHSVQKETKLMERMHIY